MKTGAEQIADERRRQIEEEGYDSDRDDRYTRGEMAMAASCYARSAGCWYGGGWIDGDRPEGWPGSWSRPGFKPKDKLRDLVRAGALIAAEIDRLQRSSQEDSCKTCHGVGVRYASACKICGGTGVVSDCANTEPCPCTRENR